MPFKSKNYRNSSKRGLAYPSPAEIGNTNATLPFPRGHVYVGDHAENGGTLGQRPIQLSHIVWGGVYHSPNLTCFKLTRVGAEGVQNIDKADTRQRKDPLINNGWTRLGWNQVNDDSQEWYELFECKHLSSDATDASNADSERIVYALENMKATTAEQAHIHIWAEEYADSKYENSPIGMRKRRKQIKRDIEDTMECCLEVQATDVFTAAVAVQLGGKEQSAATGCKRADTAVSRDDEETVADIKQENQNGIARSDQTVYTPPSAVNDKVSRGRDWDANREPDSVTNAQSSKRASSPAEEVVEPSVGSKRPRSSSTGSSEDPSTGSALTRIISKTTTRLLLCSNENRTVEDVRKRSRKGSSVADLL